MSFIVVSIALAENLYRVIFLDFREYYHHPAAFELALSAPVSAFILGVFTNYVIFKYSMEILKLPALSILITSGLAKAADFYLHHFPLITPYSFAGRSAPETATEGIFRWAGAR